MFIAMIQVPQSAIAGPGHDHGDAAPAASSNAPKRLPDGSVFLPKPSQRQLLVRTIPVKQESAPQTVELLGRVVADPNAGGKVQPTQAGRVEAGARGLPTLGQAVRKGEVLAIVRPTVSAIERANQGAQSAELRSSLELARKRLARLEQLEGTVPQKDIEAARAEVQSLSQRAALVAPSVSTVESLVAPVSGVIAASNVVAGQVVDAREVLFEIIDPARLMVEATAFDASILSNIASANLALPQNQNAALRFSGAGRMLREGAIPLQFRTTGATALPLAVGQPVKVIVHTKSQTQGFIVPNAAVVKNPSNQDIVWVHTGEEQFAARTVRWQALDGGRVTVVDGLKADERVVTQGAALLNQVR
ncbi:efflux RND transporter periplasmic adaptor subunit [Variovorax sp. PCZ-1]|nr:efflux RND transporter periplasmic adaptor subunit [Variovorax sp. PCZ-1]